jgi:hypothetical protein
MPLSKFFLCCDEGKSWIPAFAGMTGGPVAIGRRADMLV